MAVVVVVVVEVALLGVEAVVVPVRGVVEPAQVHLAFSIHERSKVVQATRAFRRRELSPARAPLLCTLVGICQHNTPLIAQIFMGQHLCTILKKQLAI